MFCYAQFHRQSERESEKNIEFPKAFYPRKLTLIYIIFYYCALSLSHTVLCFYDFSHSLVSWKKFFSLSQSLIFFLFINFHEEIFVQKNFISLLYVVFVFEAFNLRNFSPFLSFFSCCFSYLIPFAKGRPFNGPCKRHDFFM